MVEGYRPDEEIVSDFIDEARSAAESGDSKRAWELLKEANKVISGYVPGDGSDYYNFDNWRSDINKIHLTISRVSGGGLHQEKWFMGKAAADKQRGD